MSLSTKNMDAELAAKLFELMCLIRRFEEESARLYMLGKIKGFLHLYIGEEAVAAGAIPPLREDDYIVTHYRDHGHALARGLKPNAIMAELMGKETGCSGGKGGSMHLFDTEKGFMGGYAIVGGQMPIATGLALAIKQRGQDQVVACFFGDGAVNEGEFHEALNLAALWKLPVLFFLENNLYGMGTHVERSRAGGKDIFDAASAYKIPAKQINGMDLSEVRETTIDALNRVRSGDGPVFLEAICYRFRGHSMADPSAYRKSTEVDEWRDKDPLESFKQTASQQGLLSAEDVLRISDSVEKTVKEAIRFGEESARPPAESLYEHVYAE